MGELNVLKSFFFVLHMNDRSSLQENDGPHVLPMFLSCFIMFYMYLF